MKQKQFRTMGVFWKPEQISARRREHISVSISAVKRLLLFQQHTYSTSHSPFIVSKTQHEPFSGTSTLLTSKRNR